ncbi:hypothetical protein ID866_7181 [Astraeus odoratus]|nr:hypothetical protein ID866_7181 [Astraeus odoratus]
MSAASEVAIWPASDVEGVWMDGVPHLITAELEIFAAIANVEPARIPGYWYGKKGALPKPIKQTSPRQRVFLYLHGGAFIYGSAHPKDLSSYISRSLVELSDDVPHVLAVEYRLSSIYPHPRHPFPAALLDSLAGYNYLVNVMGYNPSDIIVAGDSAGGNLALALVRYLIENNGGTAGTPLPAPPGHLLLISPCPDLSNSHAKPGSAAVTYDMDLLSDRYTGKRYPPCGLLAYLGPFGLGMAVVGRSKRREDAS